MPDTTISKIRGRRVWDSRGRATVEAEIELACGASGRAIAPAGASRGAREAIDLRDADGLGVKDAVANVNGAIAAALLIPRTAPPPTTRISSDWARTRTRGRA